MTDFMLIYIFYKFLLSNKKLKVLFTNFFCCTIKPKIKTLVLKFFYFNHTYTHPHIPIKPKRQQQTKFMTQFWQPIILHEQVCVHVLSSLNSNICSKYIILNWYFNKIMLTNLLLSIDSYAVCALSSQLVSQLDDDK